MVVGCGDIVVCMYVCIYVCTASPTSRDVYHVFNEANAIWNGKCLRSRAEVDVTCRRRGLMRVGIMDGCDNYNNGNGR